MTEYDPAWDDVRDYLLDMDGRPMSLRAHADLYENLDARTVGYDVVAKPGGGTVQVRTVWDGLTMPDKSCIFATGVKHGDGTWETVQEYQTRDLAAAGHAQLVAELQNGPDAPPR